MLRVRALWAASARGSSRNGRCGRATGRGWCVLLPVSMLSTCLDSVKDGRDGGQGAGTRVSTCQPLGGLRGHNHPAQDVRNHSQVPACKGVLPHGCVHGRRDKHGLLPDFPRPCNAGLRRVGACWNCALRLRTSTRRERTKRLSASPPASFASVLAEHGAMRSRSAHLRSCVVRFGWRWGWGTCTQQNSTRTSM